MTDPVILLTGVHKSFPAWRSLRSLLSLRRPPRVPVLAGLDLSAARGTVTGIIGPNGAGKSTLLRLVTGTLVPEAGSIRVAGRDPVTEPASVAAVTGFVGGSERSFYWRLSVLENLRFFGRLQGLSGSRLERGIARALEATGSREAAGERFSVLSTGFRQRLALARAVLHDPEVLVLDEPTRSLDPETADGIRGLVAGLASSGRTVLLATHSREDLSICGTVLRLSDGRLSPPEGGAE